MILSRILPNGYGYVIGKDGYGTSIIDMKKLEKKVGIHKRKAQRNKEIHSGKLCIFKDAASANSMNIKSAIYTEYIVILSP